MEVIAQAWGSWDAAVSGATFATLKVRRARVSSARRAITRPPASLSIRSARRRPDGCPRGRRSDALRSLTRAFPPSTLPSPSLPPALAPARRWTGRCTRSPVTKDWIAVASPTILLTSLAFYFLVVGLGSRRCRPRRPRQKDPSKKDPLWIRSLVIFHNVFLIALSLYMCGGCVLEAYRNGYALWGNAYQAEERRSPVHLRLLRLEIYEFLDTFIMLLKNNLKQCRSSTSTTTPPSRSCGG